MSKHIVVKNEVSQYQPIFRLISVIYSTGCPYGADHIISHIISLHLCS